MSLRKDLEQIAIQEGFDSAAKFVGSFVVDGKRTFIDLKKYLEKDYRRYYSWEWINAYCSKLIPGYRIQKRQRGYDEDGVYCPATRVYWQNRCKMAGYDSLNQAFTQWPEKIEALAITMQVPYAALCSRYQKWREVHNVIERRNARIRR